METNKLLKVKLNAKHIFITDCNRNYFKYFTQTEYIFEVHSTILKLRYYNVTNCVC